MTWVQYVNMQVYNLSRTPHALPARMASGAPGSTAATDALFGARLLSKLLIWFLSVWLSVCAGSPLQSPQLVPIPQVTLAVQPANGGGRRDVTLTRQPIQYQPVTSELCRGGGGGADGSTPPLGYIRVATFSKQTPDAVRDAIRSLQVRAQTLLQS